MEDFSDPYRRDHDCYFFRYRDVQGHWRLVWCCGYDRIDQELAPAVVCTDPDCSLLFVRRPGQKQKCPACAAAIAGLEKKRTYWERWALAVLLLLLFGMLLYWRFAGLKAGGTGVPPVVVAEHGKDAGATALGAGGTGVSPVVPAAVRILSDQGPTVSFPVGAQFDDFRVEAEYPDGLTRIVTKKATLRTPQPPETAPLTPSNGRLVAIRPGKTTVEAEFDGVRSQHPLEVIVTDQPDVDEIRVTPSPVTLLPGESLALEAVGYKAGKSVGVLSGAGKLDWKSADKDVARVEGATVTALKPGRAAVTASLAAWRAGRPRSMWPIRSPPRWPSTPSRS